MTDDHPSGRRLAPLASEVHVCDRCRMSYELISVDDAATSMAGVPARAAELVSAVPPELLRRRPEPAVWSATEYLCHLRDVFVSYTIRLYRARTEDRPQLEPMYNDLRVIRFRHNDSEAAAVLAELAAAADGLHDEIVRVRSGGWDRLVARLPDEERTARWLLRQAMHEGVHHLDDIRRAISGPAAPGQPPRSRPR